MGGCVFIVPQDGSGFVIRAPADLIGNHALQAPDLHRGRVGDLRASPAVLRQVVRVRDAGAGDRRGDQPAARQPPHFHFIAGGGGEFRPRRAIGDRIIEWHTLGERAFIRHVCIAHRLLHRPLPRLQDAQGKLQQEHADDREDAERERPFHQQETSPHQRSRLAPLHPACQGASVMFRLRPPARFAASLVAAVACTCAAPLAAQNLPQLPHDMRWGDTPQKMIDWASRHSLDVHIRMPGDQPELRIIRIEPKSGNIPDTVQRQLKLGADDN